MKEVGNKIREIRKRKGVSQEELAEAAKVNLRTIQRIENNANEPSGKTLNLLCDALSISIDDIVDYGKSEDKTFLMLFHLSVLSFMILPLGNIIIPLILWLTKKDKIVGLKEIGANLINFQILWAILFYTSIIFGVFGKLMHSNFNMFLYSIIILPLLNIILTIVFAIRANKGSAKIYYPNFK
ncbi:MAG: helix-turn-helix domain-containing protein [Flavobacteriaceae bacterium]|nr:helix-turn-helix domain-containing protein [Flavobacteriaceae bacterium]